jgi:hypothetical protein
MIYAIAQQYDIIIPESKILDLDWKNRWNDRIWSFMREMDPYKLTQESITENIGTCAYKTTLKYKDSISDEIITIITRVDSGD